MNKTIQINGTPIGPGHRPFIIAELSANHNGSIETACEIISMARANGADAIKIQTYRADTITIDCERPEFTISGGLWDGRTLYDLYDEAHTPWDWHKPLFDYARKSGITMFSSPFDNSAVDLLEDLNAPAYKIASFEAIDLPLIRYVASTKKPMIISTGMANAEETLEAVEAARNNGCKELAILHCVSGYPAPASDYNLKTIPDMAQRFGCVVGISDHTLDNTTAIAAIAVGACIVEKHVTLDRSGGGPDDSFSLEPAGLLDLCNSSRTAWEALGDVNYERKSSEKENLVFRRSLYFVKDINKGETITADHIRSIRPGFGLPPKLYDELVGKKVVTDIEYGTPTSFDQIEEPGSI